jgi:hypothetical protein
MDRNHEQFLNVPVIRRGRHALASTMLRHFLRACLAAAASEGRSVVTIGGFLLNDSDKVILREFGFIACDEIWVKFTVRAIGTPEILHNAIASLALGNGLETARASALNAIRKATELHDSQAFAAIESRLWPAKISTDAISTFIVAIQPQWAQHFFDSDLGSQLLFGLREDLHLGVEGVYYRSAENHNLTLPGRILWYVCKGGGDGSMMIKACSQLEEVAIGKPKDLFHMFRRLGIYEWRDVYAAADYNVAKEIVAFRFRMTERFRNPVGMDTLQSLGIRGPFMSPRKISNSQFKSIYSKGFDILQYDE